MANPTPLPTKLHVLRGNPSKKKLNKREPKPIGFRKGELPPPPKQVTGIARDEWVRIAAELHRLGILTPVDVHPFAVYCLAYARWVKAEEEVGDEFTITTEKGNVVQNPTLSVARRAAMDMLKAATEFGLTPASRSRIVVTASEESDEFGSLLSN
jgi:P27 family predicted phage terminase small subunit